MAYGPQVLCPVCFAERLTKAALSTSVTAMVHVMLRCLIIYSFPVPFADETSPRVFIAECRSATDGRRVCVCVCVSVCVCVCVCMCEGVLNVHV